VVFDAEMAGGLDRFRMMVAYVRHGMTHILTGYDHLLFVTALMLAVASWKDLFKVIAVFTLAHTLTLALVVLHIIRLPALIVEPMIAASIVIVSVQNIFGTSSRRGWGRLLVAFGFGLFHGLGFAGGLLDAMTGMAQGSLVLAIASFSIGVETGHLLVVLPVFWGLSGIHKTLTARSTQNFKLQAYGSALLALAGLVYFYHALQQTAGF
jgi:hydrogenase/urease accessory protein HupE